MKYVWSVPVPDTDFCVGHQCQNGGACKDRVATYSCDCLNGYEGALCETSKIS